jgi:hypothetical protein
MSDPYWPNDSPQGRGEYGQQGDPPTSPSSQPASPDQPGTQAPTPYPYGQPYYPYGQPTAPSQPLYPYGQPGMPPYPPEGGQGATGQPPSGEPIYPPPFDPSMPLYPLYGQPAGPSQPLYPYGQPTAPYQPFYPYPGYGPPSQGLALPAPAPRKSRRGLIIGLAAGVLIVALLGTGAFVGLNQYQAPGSAAQQFCNDLKAQDYVAAYSMLSSGLTAQYPSDEFSLGAKTLDQTEGAVTSCGAASGNGYNYTLFSSTASIFTIINRAQAGSLTGTLHLVNQNGWKISEIDTSLLGVNLASLQTATGFCAALQRQDYTTAYSFFGATLQSQITQSDFVSQGALHEQIDGTVTVCGVSGLGQGNNDATTNLTVSITRSKLGQKTGQASLDVEASVWKFSSLDSGLQGSDVGGVLVIERFCSDVDSYNPHAAYELTSSAFQSAVSEASFDQVFGYPKTEIIYSCKPNLPTFSQTNATSEKIGVDFMVAAPGGVPSSIPFTAYLVLNGTQWQIDGIQ